MKKSSVLPDVVKSAPNRRKFVQLVGAAGAALGAATPGLAQAITDADILNFALNLEYLEAEFYTYATTGQTIQQMGVPVTGTGNQGPTTGARVVNFADNLTRQVALELADDERKHVIFLRNTLQNVLGVTPIAKPAIYLGGDVFDYSNQVNFLALSRLFEDVGVTAYAGAAPLISDKTVLGHAARILGTEAEHAGAIRLRITEFSIPSQSADGVDVPPPPSGPRIFSVTSDTAEVQVRTPGQVLYLVYGFMANATSGGLFPAGVNGNIKMSSGPA